MTEPKRKYSRKQLIMLIAGLLAMAAGIGILGFFGIRRICRGIHRQKLMKEHVVIEIPDLKIKAPVLEGTDNDVLREGVGHFPDTGTVGDGNYCIAGHSSTLYKEYFNPLKNAETGMTVNLYDTDKNCVSYTVTEHFIVEPNETWILNDFGDCRVTLVTCTDDGSQRRIIVAVHDDTQPS